MTSRVLLLTAIVGAAALTLTACGGGGGGSGAGPALTQGDLDRIASDPRTENLSEIFGSADTLVMPAIYFERTTTAEGQTETERRFAPGNCHQSQCVFAAPNSPTITYEIENIARLAPNLLDVTKEVTRAELDRRAGMDTSVLEGSLLNDSTITTYGIWGEYGFASAFTERASLSGTTQGVDYTGELHVTYGAVVGRSTGSNPSGLGSATWSGPAEAFSAQNRQRRLGTATITMTDLSVPVVDVDVVIDNRSIGSSAWDSIPLSNGQFAAGDVTSDHVTGDFYGPQHQESYGVFATDAYIGAFGARRTN